MVVAFVHRSGSDEREEITSQQSEEKEYAVDLGHGVNLEMVWVPGGSFQMGSPDSENGHMIDESPVHTVELDGFWMGRYEVTNAQYRCFQEDHTSRSFEGFDFNGDTQPAIYVSWNDAIAFCGWLSGKTGHGYTLPTEAQWEYACRAGTATARFWGDDEQSMGQYANAADRTLEQHFPGWRVADTTDGYVMTAPVGSFKPNAFGLYDMIGNVWEWCLDWYDSSFYSKAEARERNPVNEATAEMRVVRGGSGGDWPASNRSAFRFRQSPDTRDIGFRVCRPLGPQ